MNILIYILSFLLISNIQLSNDVTIDFNYGTVSIEGSAQEVIIKGHMEQQVIVTTETGVLIDKDYKVNNKRLNIKLEDQYGAVTILLPMQVDLECDFDDVAEGINPDGPFRKVLISGVGGAIEFNADGYDVDIKNTESHVSIVTYGNIEAYFEDFDRETIISLDTYLGSVTAHIPLDVEANLNLTAIAGEVIMDKKFNITRQLRNFKNNFIGEINGGGIDIILHSESGVFVRLEKN